MWRNRQIHRGARLGVAVAVAIGLWTVAAHGQPKTGGPPKSAEARTQISDTQQFCANVAALAAAGRTARQEKRLAEVESQIERRITELESKRVQLQELFERYEALLRGAADNLVAIYTRMRPDAAAAQLASMDEDAAAALLLRIQPKKSSAILNEMEPLQAAALTKKLSAMAMLAQAGRRQ